jgi:hypothetical protein
LSFSIFPPGDEESLVRSALGAQTQQERAKNTLPIQDSRKSASVVNGRNRAIMWISEDEIFFLRADEFFRCKTRLSLWGRRIEHAAFFCGKRGTKPARFFQALVEVLRSRVRTAQVNVARTKIFSLSFQRDPGRVQKIC